MTTYITTANDDTYDHKGAFNALGCIDWVQYVNCKVGDVFYLYCKPTRKILCKCIIEKTEIPFDEKINDDRFWNGGNVKVKKRYMRMRPVCMVDDSPFNLEYLREHGSRAPQGQERILDDEMVTDLDTFFNKKCSESLFPESDGMSEFVEGASQKVYVNKYERNPDARRKCIDVNGCYCHICGLDFSERYGDLGKGFIHVHHKVPISEIGEEYVLDPVNDLIPLCPNCHAMVHKAGCSIEAVKRVLNKKP